MIQDVFPNVIVQQYLPGERTFLSLQDFLAISWKKYTNALNFLQILCKTLVLCGENCSYFSSKSNILVCLTSFLTRLLKDLRSWTQMINRSGVGKQHSTFLINWLTIPRISNGGFQKSRPENCSVLYYLGI